MDVKMEDAKQEHHGAAPDALNNGTGIKKEEQSRSPSTAVHTPQPKTEAQETIPGNITLKSEPGQELKLSRRASQKVVQKPPPLYSDLPDATKDATSTFEVLTACHYAAKYLGYTEPPLECDCSEEWDPVTRTNNACGEDSDCINRVIKMECDADCTCGGKCQNQRFQRKQWADVSVIKTDKKGFGLRANTDLKPNDFIFEYIGEVIGEPAFRRRMIQYDDEGIKHFYFMMLGKGEFVDATKKGNLGRFCNHSCNPNCYVDKWVVGEKLRMGIFAQRQTRSGEELTFNYNVDRYGTDPQPCYCGEPNCVGFIGGKTQTGGPATKLAWSVVEALGIEDAEDWETAVSKKPRRRKTGEDDEEYVSELQPKELDQVAVRKVMATLATCKEKWIAVKLLTRIQDANDENIRFQVIRMHGYRILNNALKAFATDANVCRQICDILSTFPMLTRNKIHDSGIEVTMKKVADETEDEELKEQATSLTEKWSKLEMGFRIKKVKRDPNAVVEEKKSERRDGRERPRSRSRSPSKAVETPKGPTAPTGPRGNISQRLHGHGRPSPFRPRPAMLPEGWFQATAQNGTTYYYNAAGTTTWQRPILPTKAPPPPPPKSKTDQEVLQSLINSIVTKKPEDKAQEKAESQEPKVQTDETKKVSKEDRWRSYPEEKRKKLYENTLFPHISYVMNKYKKHLPRDELKKLGKQIAKKLVDSDFKRGRVNDPRKALDPKSEKVVKTFVKDFFDKAYQKHKERRKNEAKHAKENGGTSAEQVNHLSGEAGDSKTAPDNDDDVELSENEVDDDQAAAMDTTQVDSEAGTPGLKRSRSPDEEEASKRARTEDGDSVEPTPPPPPPPPPPPAGEPDQMEGEMSDVQYINDEQGKVNDHDSVDTPDDVAGG